MPTTHTGGPNGWMDIADSLLSGLLSSAGFRLVNESMDTQREISGLRGRPKMGTSGPPNDVHTRVGCLAGSLSQSGSLCYSSSYSALLRSGRLLLFPLSADVACLLTLDDNLPRFTAPRRETPMRDE